MTPGGGAPTFLDFGKMTDRVKESATATALNAAIKVDVDAAIEVDTGPAGAAICRIAEDRGRRSWSSAHTIARSGPGSSTPRRASTWSTTLLAQYWLSAESASAQCVGARRAKFVVAAAEVLGEGVPASEGPLLEEGAGSEPPGKAQTLSVGWQDLVPKS